MVLDNVNLVKYFKNPCILCVKQQMSERVELPTSNRKFCKQEIVVGVMSVSVSFSVMLIYSTLTYRFFEDIVRNIPLVIGNPPRPRVGVYDWRASDGQRVPHGLRRHVRQVHQHAQPVHLQHHLLSEFCKERVGELVFSISFSSLSFAQSKVVEVRYAYIGHIV